MREGEGEGGDIFAKPKGRTGRRTERGDPSS